jgi:AraC-like DNA-binding protein
MPSSRILFFTDPHPYQATVRAVETELFVTPRGEFRAQLTPLNLHRLWMQRGWEALPRVFHSVASAKRAPIVFLADAVQRALRHGGGTELSAAAIIIDGVGTTRHHRGSAPSHWASMSLTPEHVAEVRSIANGRGSTAPVVTRLVRPDPVLMGRLLALHDNVARLARIAPARLAQPEATRSLEQALIRAMIRCLTGTPLEVRTATRRHTEIIARLENLLAANQDRPLYLAEICATTGVSERTLRVCCHEHLGMGPVRYLWLRRMHLARAALIRADPASATVTSIATDHGFWELGRFSVEYRRLFGESPSLALRGAPDRRVPPNRPFNFQSSEFA